MSAVVPIRSRRPAWQEPRTKHQSNSLGYRILDKFADGEWHRIETIAEYVGESVERVDKFIKRRNWAGSSHAAEPEFREVGRHREVLIIRKDKVVSIVELTNELRPIIEAIKAESRKSQMRISLSALATSGNRLEKLLDEWSR